MRRLPESAAPAAKTCATCGRTMTWRKAWAKNWDEVKFCSDGCRSHKPKQIDAQLEQTILQLLTARGAGKTICPSEAARALAGDEPAAWQPLMEPARAAARRLVAAGSLLITQGGQVVDPSTAKGPIRLRLR
jgi:hypothetical protein